MNTLTSINSGSIEPLGRERYAETFQLLCDLSHEYEFMKEAMLGFLSDYSDGCFNLLDIGPGKGAFTKDFLLGSAIKPEIYGAYEPIPEHYQHLHDNLHQVIHHAEFTFDSFTPETELQPKWDIILLSHSMYWLQPAQPHIQALVKGLKPSGKLVFFLQPPAGFYLLQFCFEAELNQCKTRRNQHYSSYELMHDLKAVGLKASETILPGYLDFTEIWADDNKLLDMGCFLLGIELIQASDLLKKKVIHHIRSNTLQYGDDKLFNLPSSLIIASP